jgi:hypothetical protein
MPAADPSGARHHHSPRAHDDVEYPGGDRLVIGRGEPPGLLGRRHVEDRHAGSVRVEQRTGGDELACLGPPSQECVVLGDAGLVEDPLADW